MTPPWPSHAGHGPAGLSQRFGPFPGTGFMQPVVIRADDLRVSPSGDRAVEVPSAGRDLGSLRRNCSQHSLTGRGSCTAKGRRAGGVGEVCVGRGVGDGQVGGGRHRFADAEAVIQSQGLRFGTSQK